MVQKISLTVRVPWVQKTHDFVVPDNMSVERITSLMSLTLIDEYSGTLKNAQELMLIDLKDNTVLNSGCSFKQLNINSGAKLMLI